MQISPVSFNDDGTIYEEFAKKYKTHERGFFILAPSGVGKTHFCKNQSEQHWIDGDELWLAAKAHPEGPWWLESLEINDRIDQRSDVVTMEAMWQGFWIMGASCSWLKPNAIVIPDWDEHKRLIKHREENDYDGGVTSESLWQVEGHRYKIIEKWHIQDDVPLFKTIEEAVNFLTTN